MKMEQLHQTLSYLLSELHRIETTAGTLAMVEHEHFQRLTRFDHRELQEVAVEEQSAARQLGRVKHQCVAMSRKIEDVLGALGGENRVGNAPEGGDSRVADH